MVYVFDYSKHPRDPSGTEFRPQLRLSGHTDDGYGLAWSPLVEGRLMSCGDDKAICMWDTKGAVGRGAEQGPTATMKFHDDVVEDIDWHKHHQEIFASVADDSRLAM